MKKRKVLDNDIEKNKQFLIDMARLQLCHMQDCETTKHMGNLKIALHLVEPDLSNELVPECVFRCGCPYKDGCGWFDKIAEKHPGITNTCISARYAAYNEVFYGGE